MSEVGFFLQALSNQRAQEDAYDGIKAIVRLYYDNYTDADSLDGDFLAALRAVESGVEGLMIATFDDAVRDAEAELRSEGRRVRTLDAEEA